LPWQLLVHPLDSRHPLEPCVLDASKAQDRSGPENHVLRFSDGARIFAGHHRYGARMATITLPSVPRPQVVSTRPERLLSLDAFRGMTVAGMLLVNDPGSWSHIYPPLEHAAWHGWTPTDLIFPFFLFIAGITTQLSLGARRTRGDDEHAIRAQIIRRGALIFLFGFLINGFPFFTWGDVPGIADPSLFDRIIDRLHHWRVMGVLQRIGLAYLCAALLSQKSSLRQQIAIIATLLFGYWFVMTLLPVPGEGTIGALLLDTPGRTMAAWVDRAVLDWSRWGLGNHLWASSETWDPEGVLSTVPAIGTAMLGNLAGRWIGERRPLTERLAGLSAAGALAMMVGLMWHWVFPINKSLWTSSYVLFSAGMAALALATVMWIVDFQKARSWTKPFVIYGVNPIIAFVGSAVMARCIYSIFKVDLDGRRVSLQEGIHQTLFASWLSPTNASLAFAVSFVLVWLAILTLLYRRGIILKV
jgi:predicted acyltransferase